MQASRPPNDRAALLELAVRFVVAVVQVPGVRSVSLVGSITTPKPEPKDIDLLVVIDDDADVAVIAQHGRSLKGGTQSLNRGADIFLADPSGRYLGRTCSWRECWGGRRRACTARHCGQRPHLNDDLDVIDLRQDIVDAPPVTLWPELTRRRPLPDDVEAAISRLGVALGDGSAR